MPISIGPAIGLQATRATRHANIVCGPGGPIGYDGSQNDLGSRPDDRHPRRPPTPEAAQGRAARRHTRTTPTDRANPSPDRQAFIGLIGGRGLGIAFVRRRRHGPTQPLHQTTLQRSRIPPQSPLSFPDVFSIGRTLVRQVRPPTTTVDRRRTEITGTAAGTPEAEQQSREHSEHQRRSQPERSRTQQQTHAADVRYTTR